MMMIKKEKKKKNYECSVIACFVLGKGRWEWMNGLMAEQIDQFSQNTELYLLTNVLVIFINKFAFGKFSFFFSPENRFLIEIKYLHTFAKAIFFFLFRMVNKYFSIYTFLLDIFTCLLIRELNRLISRENLKMDFVFYLFKSERQTHPSHRLKVLKKFFVI